ncbi:MAG: glycine cleavage system aminomethyltransferase GcvT [Gammaproteobacteria bacterium]|nr:glycine cleavage system aminomethyltransferase GcvT [Gammaproteobacteria bacterium]
MGRETVLFKTHQEMGARIVPFGGWDMPLHYGSQLEEHHTVRRAAGMFDVSHMTVVDLAGGQAKPFLQYLLANDVAKLKTPGKALYSCMLNADGGVIDDLIVYCLDEQRYRMVVNAGTTEKDFAWINQQAANFDLQVTEGSSLAIIAVQGPEARALVLPLLPQNLSAAGELKPFSAAWSDEWFVGRTGYTGEDGFEIILPKSEAVSFWRALAEAGVAPCGLGARDTLRLEAGMNLYGSDMDEQISPLEAGLGWTIAWEPADRNFIGRQVIESRRGDSHNRRFVGLVLQGRGILRDQQQLFDGDSAVGEITSGGFSPTLERSIALARVSVDVGSEVEVEIRKKRVKAQLVKPPFVRNGKACIEL